MNQTKNKAALLLIYTGGTIGMKQDPDSHVLSPFDFKGILDQVPELSEFACRIDSVSFDPLIDSSDIEPSIWVQLAELIEREYEKYDGFVILHGTDTMAYSASALSYMLENLSKPVVFTGSQLPIGVPRTDGKENLITAIEIAAAKDDSGNSMVPEVCVYFDNSLIRGNRSRKVSAENFSAFSSPGLEPLATAGIEIRYNLPAIRKYSGGAFHIHTNLDTRVSILKIHPGITPQVVRNILCGEETRAVIIETYGSGNAPSKEWFLDIVRQAAAMGKILVNVTQCLAGRVNMDIYSNGKALKDCSVIGGGDLTTEGALGKLFFLMGEYSDNEIVKKMMLENLRGEISE